ncbi:FGGY-family carbohydrate kinase [Olivibacter ginsenosidimutans]|uniref:FGGY-family carbohydrate kinase n=1 Tax=Olivibacter ginsenosidimutans TaxID=1176537 RepID=A0ABP9BQQ0_9SPHI
MSQQEKEAYLIVDIGTGNARVAAVLPDGTILSLKRQNVLYETDHDYPDALSFDPEKLWKQILEMSREVLLAVDKSIKIAAITATSQREGIVVIDAAGKALIGMSNHDNRGREWEHLIQDKSAMYQVVGRYPTALFSALKLVGFRERKQHLWPSAHRFTSISDWITFKFSDQFVYEHSQASETLLYDVQKGTWNPAYCALFGLSPNLLPPLKTAGTVLGPVLPALAEKLAISPKALVITGGSDTQVAIKSVAPTLEDVIIVSGTTTPVIQVVDQYLLDEHERTWTGRHVDKNAFVLEANAGVTGLNYQRLKEIFYPKESYDTIEEELNTVPHQQCIASLGSLVANEKSPLTKGGFIFNAPVSHQLTRGDFVWAILWDIACSIYENYKTLCAVAPHHKNYLLACGGGVQSRALRQFLANLLDKKIIIRDTYRQSSVIGAAFICNDALGKTTPIPHTLETTVPKDRSHYLKLYQEWQTVRQTFKQVS